MPLLTTAKPKKAKFGMKATYAGSSILDIGVLIRETLGTPQPPAIPPYRGDADPWWDEVTSNMGQIGYLIYFNDEALYNRLLNANEAT